MYGMPGLNISLVCIMIHIYASIEFNSVRLSLIYHYIAKPHGRCFVTVMQNKSDTSRLILKNAFLQPFPHLYQFRDIPINL